MLLIQRRTSYSRHHAEAFGAFLSSEVIKSGVANGGRDSFILLRHTEIEPVSLVGYRAACREPGTTTILRLSSGRERSFGDWLPRAERVYEQELAAPLTEQLHEFGGAGAGEAYVLYGQDSAVVVLRAPGVAHQEHRLSMRAIAAGDLDALVSDNLYWLQPSRVEAARA